MYLWREKWIGLVAHPPLPKNLQNINEIICPKGISGVFGTIRINGVLSHYPSGSANRTIISIGNN